MKILVAEDDEHIRRGLEEILAREGYEVLPAVDGRQAVARFDAEMPDLALLDIMMPGVDGYEVCRHIARQRPGVPIIFISAKSEEIDRVVGLELGADDFIVKPFGIREVIARIRAVTRRTLMARAAGQNAGADCFEMGDLTILPSQLRARRGAEVIELSLRDIRILQLLHQKRGCVVDRHTLFDVCWGLDHIPNSRTLDQHVSQLRKRIERDPRHPEIIRTVHGIGYRFDG